MADTLSFVLLILNAVAFVLVLVSDATLPRKLLWLAIVLLLPGLGFLIWLALGPKGDPRRI